MFAQIHYFWKCVWQIQGLNLGKHNFLFFYNTSGRVEKIKEIKEWNTHIQKKNQRNQRMKKQWTFERMERMVAHNRMQNTADLTWGAGGSTANRMQNMICVESMMHLTYTNMPVEKIDHALQTIKVNGLQNVLALCSDRSGVGGEWEGVTERMGEGKETCGSAEWVKWEHMGWDFFFFFKFFNLYIWGILVVLTYI